MERLGLTSPLCNLSELDSAVISADSVFGVTPAPFFDDPFVPGSCVMHFDRTVSEAKAEGICAILTSCMDPLVSLP